MKIVDTLKRNVSFDGDNADQRVDLNGFPLNVQTHLFMPEAMGFFKVGRVKNWQFWHPEISHGFVGGAATLVPSHRFVSCSVSIFVPENSEFTRQFPSSPVRKAGFFWWGIIEQNGKMGSIL